MNKQSNSGRKYCAEHQRLSSTNSLLVKMREEMLYHLSAFPKKKKKAFPSLR
jgi:hypothetical protein